MSEDEPGERPWKRIARLTMWLWILPPVGIWKLWKDTSLSASDKWRIFIYLFIMPILLYFTASVWFTGRMLQHANV
jgi:hypothetical protein